MTAESNKKPNARRLFRRLRSQFKRDSGLQKLTGADRMLIDQAALLALRARQMRDAILTGDKPVSDEDMVRTTNCCIRAMAALRTRDRPDDDGQDVEPPQAQPDSGLDAIEIFLREKREREEKDKANG